MIRRSSGALLLIWLGSCVPAGPDVAHAELRLRDGTSAGSARFTPAENGVHVRVQARNLPPGVHGMHVHEAGACEPPDFSSAGEHFNPGGTHHAHDDPAGHHAGDLPNLAVAANGEGTLEAVLPGILLSGRGHHSLFHKGGTSLVIHAAEDNLRSNPSGGSGERIACGAVKPGEIP